MKNIWPKLFGGLLLLVFSLVSLNSFAQNVDLFPVVSVSDYPKVAIPFTIEVDIHNEAAPGVVASGVMVTNILPPQFTFVSCSVATYVQRDNTYDGTLPYYSVSSTNYGNMVVCDAGNIKNGFYRPIFITVRANQPGIFNNQTTVKGNGTDTQPGNNLLIQPVLIHTNGLTIIGGQFIAEQSGSNAVFTVQLAPSNSVTVTVDYQTIDGTAKAGEDYQPVSGTLIFPPGVTNQSVSVPVLDDLLEEADSQSFTLQLSNAVNAGISGPAQFNYILDDEPPILISISDAAPVLEGDTITNLIFPVHLSGAADVPVSVYFSATGTLTTNGTVTISPFATNQTLVLPVLGNLAVESNRVAHVTLYSPSLGDLGQATAEGTIVEDDGQPGKFDHMEISAVPSPQIAGRPFTVTLRVKDYFNNPATNYVSDMVQVLAYRLVGFSSQIEQTVLVTNFIAGVGTAVVTYTNIATNANIVAWKPVGNFYTTASTPQFTVISPPTLFLSLPATATEGDGTIVGAGRISITNVDVQDVVVQLASSDAAEIMVPTSVIIPAGQTSAVFDVSIVDDTRLDGTHSSFVSATSIGYSGASRGISINDNESATLAMTLPAGLSEAKGSNTGVGVISVSSPPTLPILVSLTSSDTSELVVPCCVFIQAGQTSATFNVTIPDDTTVDGPQSVTVTAHVTNWVDGIQSALIADNDAVLSISSSRDLFSPVEGGGTFANGLQIRAGGTMSNALTVQLVSSNPSKIILPASVVIPAGQQSVNVDITFADDNLFDGTTLVIVTASASNFVSGTKSFSILDNDIHHFSMGAVSSPKTYGVSFSFNFDLREVNNILLSAFRGSISLSALRDGVVLSVAPSSVTNFSKGLWSGSVTVNGWGTNIQLVATATNGVSGQSNPFTIPVPAWVEGLRIQRAELENGAMRLFFNTFTGKVYQVQASTNFGLTSWIPLGTAIPGTGNEASFLATNATAEMSRFFRLAVPE